MDFGKTIGKYSQTKVFERKIKNKKLKHGKKLLEWFATKRKFGLYKNKGGFKINKGFEMSEKELLEL